MNRVEINNLAQIKQAQFIENVLGIHLSPEDTGTILEGKLPTINEQQILLETQIYEGFLDDLAKTIGGIPKDVTKTLTDVGSVFKFIHNVIADKSGENLQKAIIIIRRNAMSLFAKINRLGAKLPENIKQLFNEIVEWIKTNVKGLLSVQSDVDDTDDVHGEGGNWKKFMLLLLVGMVLVFLKQIPELVTSFGGDVLKSSLIKLWNMTTDLVSKFLSSPKVLLKLVTGSALIKVLIPILTIYKSAKVLQPIQNDLLDNNAWLKKK